MDLRDSPYVPGAGTRPFALVGRERIVDDFAGTLERLERGRAATAPVITGPRGSGKTVLLNELLRVARDRRWFTAIEEVTPAASLAELMAMMARDVLFEMSARRRFTERVQRALGVLKAFTGVKAFGIELTIDAQAVTGKADSGDLARDLRDLFVELGTLGHDHGVGVVFGLDEIHAVDNDALDSLYFALHRVAQDNLPVAFVSCGLFPSWQTESLDQPAPALTPSSYVSRMYAPFCVRLTPLSVEESRRALAEPAVAEGCSWTSDALDHAIDYCEGNAWLLQMLGNAAWKVAAGPDITYEDVVAAQTETEQQLAQWFIPRVLRAVSRDERRLLTNMAGLRERGATPFAALLERLDDWSPDKLVQTTAQLARRDLAEIERGAGQWVSIAHDSVCFTVPRLGTYIRQNELIE